MKALFSVLLALSLLVAPHLTNAQGEALIQEMREWMLWNDCQPISLNIGISDRAIKEGLSRKKVEAAIETRFRSARIYGKTGNNLAFFGMIVDVANSAFTVEGSLQIRTYRQMQSEEWRHGPTTTWLSSTFGTYNNPEFILENALSITDNFITDYLRVNYDDC